MSKYGRSRNQVYSKSLGIKNIQKRKPSIYIPFSVLRPRKDDGIRKDRLKYGIISHKKPVYDYYVAEFDGRGKKEPHIHIWKATNGGSRISDTRSEGVSLFSGTEFGIISVSGEERDNKSLSSIQKEEIIEFFETHKKSIFAIEFATHLGVKLDEYSFDEGFLKSKFSETDWSLIEREYKKFCSQKYFA